MTIGTATDVGLRIVPETPTFGAVIEGVRAKEPLSDEVVETLKAALTRYKVIFFRGLHLSRDEHLAFASHFGEVWKNPSGFVDYEDDGVSGVTVVLGFHADAMYLPQSPSFSMLRMLELPEVGGDTIWLDLVSSYADMSEQFRGFLETLTVFQGQKAFDLTDDELGREYKRRTGLEIDAEGVKRIRASLTPWEAPLVRVIPETGVKNYWVSAQHTRGIKGLSKEESDAVLGVLFRHQVQPKYVYRWRWQVGDLAFWDHRTTLHSGVADFGSEKRYAQRVSVANNQPIGVSAFTGGPK